MNYLKLRSELSNSIVKKVEQLSDLINANIDGEDRIELYGKYLHVLQNKSDEFLSLLGIHLNDSLKKIYVDVRQKTFVFRVNPSERFEKYKFVRDTHNGRFLSRGIDHVKGVLIALDYIKLLDGKDAPIESILLENKF
jgi:hypothetical protein